MAASISWGGVLFVAVLIIGALLYFGPYWVLLNFLKLPYGSMESYVHAYNGPTIHIVDYGP